MLNKLVLLLFCICLGSCSDIDVNRYSQETPKLELRDFFSGRVDAWGMFQKRSGEVIKRFHAVINSHSEGDRFIMHEDFTYSDGTKQTRVWTLHPDGPGRGAVPQAMLSARQSERWLAMHCIGGTC